MAGARTRVPQLLRPLEKRIMPGPLRLAAQPDPTCPAGTKLVVVPRADGAEVRLLVPEKTNTVVVMLNDDGSVGWIEDSETGRGIMDRVRPAPAM